MEYRVSTFSPILFINCSLPIKVFTKRSVQNGFFDWTIIFIIHIILILVLFGLLILVLFETIILVLCVLENFILERKDQPPMPVDESWKSEFALD